MKKKNGGYALPYVLVVMTILSLVSVSIMSNVLRGLQTQQASVERMQDKYTVEGNIEKVFAQLHTMKGKEIQTTEAISNEDQTFEETEAEKDTKAKERIRNAFDTEVKKCLGTEVKFVKSTYDTSVYTCELTSENEGATISCIMNLKVSLKEKDVVKSEDKKEVTYAYTIESLEITYSSYVITYK